MPKKKKMLSDSAKYYKNIKAGNVIQCVQAGNIKYSGSEDLKHDSRVKII